MEQIHGHEVIQMMMQSGKSYSRETLRADIVSTFGPDARFFACSADNMTPDELISFLEMKGKFVPSGDGFQTSADLMCKH